MPRPGERPAGRSVDGASSAGSSSTRALIQWRNLLIGLYSWIRQGHSASKSKDYKRVVLASPALHNASTRPDRAALLPSECFHFALGEFDGQLLTAYAGLRSLGMDDRDRRREPRGLRRLRP